MPATWISITVRHAYIRDGKLTVRAGAGIVADSHQECERQETINKAGSIHRAFRCSKAMRETRLEAIGAPRFCSAQLVCGDAPPRRASVPRATRPRRHAAKEKFMIFMIDHFDSFTYNLFQYFGMLGCESR